MLTGQITCASVRKLPSRLAIILVALGLLNIHDCARRCCYETQMIQTEARAAICRPNYGVRPFARARLSSCSPQRSVLRPLSVSDPVSFDLIKAKQPHMRHSMLTVQIISAY